MATFILAVLFFPITLIYFFFVYVAPLLFKALVVLMYGVLYFMKENPELSILIILTSYVYLYFTEPKDKNLSQEVDKPQTINIIEAKPLQVPDAEFHVDDYSKISEKMKKHILKKQLAQKVMFVYLKASAKECLYYPAYSRITPSFKKRDSTEAYGYFLKLGVNQLSIYYEFGFDKQNKKNINTFHVVHSNLKTFSFDIKHELDPDEGYLLLEKIEIQNYIEGSWVGCWEDLVNEKFKNKKKDNDFFNVKREIVFISSFF